MARVSPFLHLAGRYWLTFLAISWLWTAIAAAANPIEDQGLGLPLACTLGQTCWVANYVDVDISVEVKDFRCRKRTYDTHDGVDFAIRDLGVMEQRVPVVASAPGVVKNVRDGMQDVAISDEASRARIKGRECGNGVLIDHEGNWQTQHCHLRQGSIKVKAGDRVETGSALGLVGLSGKTEFPHVHLTVRKKGKAIDPFTGQEVSAGCGKEGNPLWRADLSVPYEEVALYNAGFSAGKPDMAAIRNGKRDDGPLAATAPALVLLVDIFGVEAGDKLWFLITDPDGKPIFEHVEQIEKTQARRFVFAGKKLTIPSWPTGTYTGRATLTRKMDGQEMKSDITRTVTIR
ncbi:MAG: M23 family metallopeptidase [Nitrospira sp.]|nr:M23 family metallopeptidase [Nitrospira sp.]